MKFVPVCIAVAALAFASGAAAAPRLIHKCGITISQPGSYMLADNLDSVGDCLIVRSDFVTIDLDGFAIRGDGTGAAVSSHGTTGFIAHGLVVRNGTITRFMNGLEIDDGIVEGVRAIDNTNEGILVVNGTVRNSFAEGNANDGITVGPGTLVLHNESTHNGDTGITAGLGSSVTGNVVSYNASYGIAALIGSGSVLDNNALANGNSGLIVQCPALVMGNRTDTGIQTFGGVCTSDHNSQ